MKLAYWCTVIILLWGTLTFAERSETLDELLEMEDISEFSMIFSHPTMQPIVTPPSQITAAPTTEVASITRTPTVPPTCFDPKCKPKPEPKPEPPKKHPPHKKNPPHKVHVHGEERSLLDATIMKEHVMHKHPPSKKHPPHKPSPSAETTHQLRAREDNEVAL